MSHAGWRYSAVVKAPMAKIPNNARNAKSTPPLVIQEPSTVSDRQLAHTTRARIQPSVSAIPAGCDSGDSRPGSSPATSGRATMRAVTMPRSTRSPGCTGTLDAGLWLDVFKLLINHENTKERKHEIRRVMMKAAFRVFVLSCFRASLVSQLHSVPLTCFHKESSHAILPVVRVGPGPGDELAALEAQRHLGKDALIEVNAVRLVLGGRQHELAQLQCAGVQVQRPWLGISSVCRQLCFEPVGQQFDLRQPIRRQQTVENEEAFDKPDTHLFFVVARLTKLVIVAHQSYRSVGIDEALPGPGEHFQVTTEGSDNELNGDVLADCGHQMGHPL